MNIGELTLNQNKCYKQYLKLIYVKTCLIRGNLVIVYTRKKISRKLYFRKKIKENLLIMNVKIINLVTEKTGSPTNLMENKYNRNSMEA